jgi:DNA-binding transcriptional regulator YhcF (GntR family)
MIARYSFVTIRSIIMPEDLQENELKVLKQLHDEKKRPPATMARRIDLKVEDVNKALDTLSEKGYVEKQRKKKWKITYEGIARLGFMPHDVTRVGQALHRLAKAEKDDVQEIAASQIGLLKDFYDLALDQARKGFQWALAASIVGFGLLIIAIIFVLRNDGINVAIITTVSGAILEVIAGINFVLYSKTLGQLSTFHDRLDVTQRFLLANSLCESITGDLKNKTRAEIITRLTSIPSSEGGEGSD